MDNRQDRQSTSIAGAIAALTAMASVCPELKELKAIRLRLIAIRTEIQAQDAKQISIQRRGEAAWTVSLRKAVRTDQLIPCARRARRLFKHDPTVMTATVLPHAHDSLEKHAASALALAKALAPHTKFCVAEGFPKGFVRDLKATAKRLREQAKQSTVNRHASNRATTTIPRLIATAREDIGLADSILKAEAGRRRSDVAFRSHLKDWEFKTVVGKRIGRPKTKGRPKKPPQ